MDQDYLRRQAAREWARRMVRKDIEWDIYVSLRDGVNPWQDPGMIPTVEFLDGFYGQDWPVDE
jgi:hypothetical protein